jgi:hypothetical protein
MAKKQTLEQRASGEDIALIVKSLRENSPEQTGADLKKLLKLLGQDSCPVGLLMWSALCGSIEMKQIVAKNKTSDQSVLDALMLDSESAPFYVVDLLQKEEIFQHFIVDLFGNENPFSNVLDLDELVSENYNIFDEDRWKTLIPTQGYCSVMQAELVRIVWRLCQIANYMNAYQLRYEDQMFVVLNHAIDSLSGISQFSKNVLRALLRWSHIKHRSMKSEVLSYGMERTDPIFLIVNIYLRQNTEPVQFDKNIFYKEY